MGLHKWWQVIKFVIILYLFFLSSSLVEGSLSNSHETLDDLLCKQASQDRGKPKTGVFYNVSIPSNLTGIEVSVVRLRTVSFWSRGVNHSYVNLPPHIVTQPNRMRMAILFENLGNWSSHYYNVPNYTMVAPIFGFMAYTSSVKSLVICEKLNLVTHGNPITIRFPHVLSHTKNVTPICAKFGDGGTIEFSNMTRPYLCEAKSQGHYTLVIPSPPKVASPKSKGFNKWWVLGFVIGLVVLVLLILVLVALVKAVKKRRLRKMEKNSEGGEAFDTFWIGETKLPLATMVRTQPALEHGDVTYC